MTSAQVVETSVNVTNTDSPSRDYSHPDDQTTQTITVVVLQSLNGQSSHGFTQINSAHFLSRVLTGKKERLICNQQGYKGESCTRFTWKHKLACGASYSERDQSERSMRDFHLSCMPYRNQRPRVRCTTSDPSLDFACLFL